MLFASGSLTAYLGSVKVVILVIVIMKMVVAACNIMVMSSMRMLNAFE